MGRKMGAAVALSGGGEVGSPSNTVWPGLRPTSVVSTKWHLNSSSRLATIDTWAEKWKLLCPAFLGGEELGLHLTQCRLGRGLPPYQMAVIHPTVWLVTIHQRHRQTNKPVGFYDPIAPPVPTAPSSDPRNDADATFVDPNVCRRLLLHDAATPPELLLHATIGGMLPEWQTSKCISSVSFFRIKSNFFTTHRRHRRKKRWTRILKFEFCDF